jgi:hypothetical protein
MNNSFKFIKKFSLLLVLSITYQAFAMEQPESSVSGEKFEPNEEICKKSLDINEAVACMLKGYRNIYWGPQSDLKRLDVKLLPGFKSGTIKKVVLLGNLGDTFYGNILILYLNTSNGKKNAVLLAKYFDSLIANEQGVGIRNLKKKKDLYLELEKHYKDLLANNPQNQELLLSLLKVAQDKINSLTIQINWLEGRLSGPLEKEAPEHNHYLVGFLLGYPEKNIEKFYQAIKSENFLQDKAEAEKFIEENQQTELADDIYLLKNELIKIMQKAGLLYPLFDSDEFAEKAIEKFNRMEKKIKNKIKYIRDLEKQIIK